MTTVGIALGGGGIRSMAAIGVLRELEAVGFPVHHVAGTSAGAIVGACYAAGIPLPAMEKAARNLSWTHLFEPGLLLRRMIPGRRLMRFISGLLGEERTFESLQKPLALTSVDITRGQLVVFDSGPLLPAIRASLALPGAIRPVTDDDGRILVDGGVLSAVPTQVLRDAGCDVVVAIDVRAEAPGAFRPLSRMHRNDLFLRVGEVMSIYITNLALTQADIVIRPPVEGIDSFAVKRIGECIEAGAQAVRQQTPELMALLERRGKPASEGRSVGVPQVTVPTSGFSS